MPGLTVQVLEHFFAKYDLDSPLRQYLLQRADVLSEERKALERELVPTLALKAALESQVSSLLHFLFVSAVFLVFNRDLWPFYCRRRTREKATFKVDVSSCLTFRLQQDTGPMNKLGVSKRL